MSDRMFPLQTSRNIPPGPMQIPWSVAEKAYGAYAQQYGTSQSLERLAERGGFGWCEMDTLYPPWRKEVDQIAALLAERDRLAAELAELRAAVKANCPECKGAGCVSRHEYDAASGAMEWAGTRGCGRCAALLARTPTATSTPPM